MKTRISILLVLLTMYFPVEGQTNSIGSLQIGDTIGNFSATDANGNTWTLENALNDGPIVLVFYRGQWCPHCNRHLSEIQENLDSISNLGAQVIAISPERIEKIAMTISKTSAEFTLLWDAEYKISDYFGLTFQPTKANILLYNTMLGADLNGAHSDSTGRLPIPATYIIGVDSTVKWLYVDENYKNRSSTAEIIRELRFLNN